MRERKYQHQVSRVTYFVLLHHIFHQVAAASLQALVCDQLKSNSCCVVAGRLLCIAHVEGHMIESNESAAVWLCFVKSQ